MVMQELHRKGWTSLQSGRAKPGGIARLALILDQRVGVKEGVGVVAARTVCRTQPSTPCAVRMCTQLLPPTLWMSGSTWTTAPFRRVATMVCPAGSERTTAPPPDEAAMTA